MPFSSSAVSALPFNVYDYNIVRYTQNTVCLYGSIAPRIVADQGRSVAFIKKAPTARNIHGYNLRNFFATLRKRKATIETRDVRLWFEGIFSTPSLKKAKLLDMEKPLRLY